MNKRILLIIVLVAVGMPGLLLAVAGTIAFMMWRPKLLSGPPLIVMFPVIGDVLCGSIVVACLAYLGWVGITQPTENW